MFTYCILLVAIGPEARGREFRPTEDDETVGVVGKVIVHEDDGLDHVVTIDHKPGVPVHSENMPNAETKEIAEHHEKV